MGDTIHYRVIAEGSFGDSTPSPSDSVTLADALLAPPGDLTASPSSDSSVLVNLTAPVDDPGGLTYTIERAPDSGGSPGTFSAVASGISSFPHTVSGMAANTRFHFRAKPTKAGLADGPYSRIRAATTLVDQPQSVTASHDTAGCFETPVAYRVDVAWSNANQDGNQRTDVGTEWQYRVGIGGTWTSAGTAVAGATSKALTVADQTTHVRGRYVGESTWVERTVLVDCPS